jgi:hypothetical protein
MAISSAFFPVSGMAERPWRNSTTLQRHFRPPPSRARTRIACGPGTDAWSCKGESIHVLSLTSSAVHAHEISHHHEEGRRQLHHPGHGVIAITPVYSIRKVSRNS